ncbi:homoserine kinase [Aliikangiella maris]|uniref:Homoserine kinase n=2 Tax=Aliikangiella maris TaxID=3162458 RepID=A0ABV2BSZ5_9GAMM
MSVSVFAPISVGNVSVGFDTLGLALTPVDGSLVGDIVTVEAFDQSSVKQQSNNTENALSSEFVLAGTHASRLPAGAEKNIVWRCYQAFEKALSQKQVDAQAIKITLHKNIPVSSGLGSSACSVVAAFAALNTFYNTPFSEHELLLMMGELEGEISGSVHYDNVAPCYLGGLQLMLNDEQQVTQPIPTFDDCYWVIAYPDVEVSTKAAREILPQNYSRATLITFGQNLAGFIDASHRQNKQQAFRYLTDIVAEPYRAQLLPNFADTKAHLLASGALAVGISGSGPTLFAVTDDRQKAEAFQQWLNDNYLQTPEGFVHICQVDHQGARKI